MVCEIPRPKPGHKKSAPNGTLM